MPYAAPNERQAAIMAESGPGRRPSERAHPKASTGGTSAAVHREENQSLTSPTHPPATIRGELPARSPAILQREMSKDQRSSSSRPPAFATNRYQLLSDPSRPALLSRSDPTVPHFPGAADTDSEDDYASVSDGSSMSLDDIDWDFSDDGSDPTSAHSRSKASAESQGGVEGFIPPALFQAPQPNYAAIQAARDAGRDVRPMFSPGTIQGITSHSSIQVAAGAAHRAASSKPATSGSSRYPVWEPNRLPVSPPLCLICEKKPVHITKSGVRYPTCGLSCAAKLAEQDKRTHSSRSGPSTSSSSWPGKCIVCKSRDVHVSSRTGRRYPTCGLTCASTLKPSGAEAQGKCDHCRKRDKAVSKTTGRPYEYCGRECRDRAKSLLEKAMKGTCQTCLVCLRTVAPDPERPQCSPQCRLAAEALAPAMIEIPRGHVLFDSYHHRFHDGWDKPANERPTVVHMYFFALTAGVVGRSEGYRDALRASSHGKNPAEEEGWIAIPRECNTGDSGQVNLCSSPSCLFCDLVCNAIQHARVPGGMTVYSSAAQASEGLGVPEAMRSKVALIFVKLLRAVGKKVPEATTQQIMSHGPEMRRENPIVKIVLTKQGRKAETGAIYVFEPAAILPLGCVIVE